MPDAVVKAAAADPAARAHLLLARMALAAAVLTFVVIVASAFMRHAQAGLSCDDWPACYARVVAADADTTPSAGVRLARIAHRIAATGVLALVIGMLLVAWTQTPAWKREGALALCALVIAVALAVLGIATPGARLPPSRSATCRRLRDARLLAPPPRGTSTSPGARDPGELTLVSCSSRPRSVA